MNTTYSGVGYTSVEVRFEDLIGNRIARVPSLSLWIQVKFCAKAFYPNTSNVNFHTVKILKHLMCIPCINISFDFPKTFPS